MTEHDLKRIEGAFERAREVDLEALDRADAERLREALDEIPWMLSELRRLRRDPGRLGAMLRLRRIERGLDPEALAREASRRPEAGSVAITPEEVRALEEGIEPLGARWPDVLAAIGAVLGIPAAELRAGG